ncbi:MAG: hypothetical protein ACRCX2_39280, partial [Paraclostridium sp.]
INIVGSISKDIYTLEINPLIEELRQFSKANLYVVLRKNGEVINDLINITSSGEVGSYKMTTSNLKSLDEIDPMLIEQIDYLNLNDIDGVVEIQVECLKPSSVPLQITLTSKYVTKTISIGLEPIF